MRIPYAFHLTSTGTLEITENEAEAVRMIFDYYLAGVSLGKVVDMLYAKQISSPTGKVKWTRAAVDHLISNSKNLYSQALNVVWPGLMPSCRVKKP